MENNNNENQNNHQNMNLSVNQNMNLSVNQNMNLSVNQNIGINQNEIQRNDNNYSFSRYKKAIKTVLKPLGDTSYLNTVLYTLGNIRNIASYFLNPKNQNYINKRIGDMPLSYVFERLLLHFYPYPENDKKEIYEPSSFLKVLGTLNSTYNTFQKRNPNELIIFILETLHKDLNLNKANNNNNNLNLNFNTNDKKSVIKNEIINIQNSENSIIYNNFNWFEIKESKCTKCNNTKYELLTFKTFSLDIQNSKKNENDYFTIYDCLKYYQATKKFNICCNQCKNNNQLITTNIFSTPNIFIFLLDRGIDLDEKNNLINIPFYLFDKIDLNNFIENRNTPQKYEIIGIISIDIKEKKYVNFCMSPIDKLWYFYKDENIEQADITNIIDKHNNFKELIPCILIYKFTG